MKTPIYILFVMALFWFGACENEKNTFSDRSSLYLGGDPDQSATADSILFSFKMHGDAVTTYDLNLKVYLAGVTVATDRTFELEVVDEKTTAPAGTYSLGTSFVLPANASVATVPITVSRSVSGVDMSKNSVYLIVRVKENGNFAVGAQEYCTYKLEWCDYLVRPAWWPASRGMHSYAGPFTQARYKFIIDYYGDIDLHKMGIIGSDGYAVNYAKFYAMIAEWIDLLNEYNATHATPYMNDDGVTPLRIGAGLTY